MSFWRNYYHIVWATKNREPLITPEIEPRLFAYIVRKAAELGAYIYAIDGWTEHTHVVTAIPPHVAVSHLVKMAKGASSHDLNQQGLPVHFAWQRGYGVLTLGQRQLADAIAYVQRQKQHHAQNTALAWLERYEEVDEGPPELIGHHPPSVPTLRQPSAIYQSLGDSPF